VADLNWCAKQRSGIGLIQPNDNLAKEYIKSAEETLASLKNSNENSNMWKATKKYYAEYFAVYALFMGLGIKCEIHDCTIELINLMSTWDLFPDDSYRLLKKDKKLRIDNQYYLKNVNIEINYEELFEFILIIKEKVNSLTPMEVESIRDKLKLELGLI